MSKILILSIPPTNKNGSNTYEMIFHTISKKYKLTFLCCRDGENNSDTFEHIYTLSERKAIKSLFNRKIDVFEKTNNLSSTNNQLSLYKKNNHFHNIKRIARDIIWSLSNWKKSSLKRFLLEEKFDYIVASTEGYHYFLRILNYICKISNARLILYTWDDNFSYKQQQISPLFYIYRFVTRKLLRKISKKYLYKSISISEKTKIESDKFLNTKSLIIKKPIHQLESKNKSNKIIKLIYAGNLLNGRDKTILRIAKILQDKQFGGTELHIYSNFSNKFKSKLLSYNNVFINKPVNHAKLLDKELVSDIGLMIESLSFTKRKISRLSLSTKFSDYINTNLPILAIIDDKSATAYEINNNDLGLVISNKKDIKNGLLKMIERCRNGQYEDIINQYALNNDIEKQKKEIEKLFQ